MAQMKLGFPSSQPKPVIFRNVLEWIFLKIGTQQVLVISDPEED